MKKLVESIIRDTHKVHVPLRMNGVSLLDEKSHAGFSNLDIKKIHFMLVESQFPTKVLSEEEFPEHGFVIRQEEWDTGFEGKPTAMEAAYSLIDDSYIGDSKETDMLVKRGIKPEAHSGNSVASIGFCEKEQKWYGWSHRAIYGFGIGDKVKEGDSTASSGWTDDYLQSHPDENTAIEVGFEAKTLEDAKRMAIAFAASVS